MGELLGLDGWSFHQMGHVPVSLREPFALALVDVLSALEDAISEGDLVGRDRALKALALLPTLLLRLPPRDPDKTTKHAAILYERIGKWTNNDLVALVQELENDAHVNATAAAAGSDGRSNSSGDTASRTRALATKLIREGDLRRARCAITSSGCADLSDQAVVAELASKYPQARQPFDTSFLDEPDFPRVQVEKTELAKVFGKLDPLTAQGVSGWRNPYITAVSLVDSFATHKAKSVLTRLRWYGELYVNGELPEWWYFVTCSTRGLALNKPGRQAGVRPIGITCRLHAAIERAAFFSDAIKQEWAAYLAQNGQQAVGVKSGGTNVVISASLFYELEPEAVLLNLDCANAFNEIDRAKVVEALARPDTPATLRAFARHAAATLSPASAILYRTGGARELAPYRSVQGVTQGSVSSMPYFCIAIHAALGGIPTDQNLATLGFADDLSLLGKAADMAAALPGLKADLGAVGLRLQESKSSYACREQAEMDALAYIGDLGAGIPLGEYTPPGEFTPLAGHVKCGIPIGEPAFVRVKLAEKYAEIAAEIRLVHDTLRGDPQLQFAMLRGSSVFRLDYLLQHCHPDDTEGIAADFDALIRELLEDALASKLDTTSAHRVSFSVRNGGFGLRSREALRAPAAIGALAKTVRRLLPTDGDGGILNGNLTAIVDAVGRGSFEDGNYDLGPFLASGSRHAAFLAAWWPEAQSYASGTIGQAPTSGALAKDVEQAGMGLSNPQHALTSQLDSAARAVLIDSLPYGSRDRRAIECCDRFSQAPFTLAPTKANRIPADEFREIAARHAGMPSPACAPYVGRPLDVSGRGGDGTVDKHGDHLITACTTGNHDANFRHNPLRDAVAHVAKMFGAVSVRIEDGHYFLRALTPQALFAAINEGNLTARLRGVTPDITIRLDPSSQQQIYEVKVIGYGKSWYPVLPASSSAKYGVEKRAQSVPGEYARKLRAHDVKFGMRARANDGGPPGPLEASLATANLQVLVSGAFGEGNKGLHSFVRELADSGAPRLQAKLGLDASAAAARIRRVAYERIGLAIARGHAQQLLARLGCVDVLRAHRNGAHVGDAVLACEGPTLLLASDRGNDE